MALPTDVFRSATAPYTPLNSTARNTFGYTASMNPVPFSLTLTCNGPGAEWQQGTPAYIALDARMIDTGGNDAVIDVLVCSLLFSLKASSQQWGYPVVFYGGIQNGGAGGTRWSYDSNGNGGLVFPLPVAYDAPVDAQDPTYWQPGRGPWWMFNYPLQSGATPQTTPNFTICQGVPFYTGFDTVTLKADGVLDANSTTGSATCALSMACWTL
jgi:hypothetical protein